MESYQSTVLRPALFIQWYIMNILSYHIFKKFF